MGNVNYLEDPAVVIFDSDGNVKRNSETIGNLVCLEGDEKKIPYYDAEKGFHKISNPGWITSCGSKLCSANCAKDVRWSSSKRQSPSPVGHWRTVRSATS